MITRTFQNIPDNSIDKADQSEFLIGLGWNRGSDWDELLLSKRVLIISEAGSGKTYECRDQFSRLVKQGKFAFFLELTSLAHDDFSSLLTTDEAEKFQIWLLGKTEEATFFLDSIDELMLTMRTVESALKKFIRAIGNSLKRARIIITTRPTIFDKQLIQRLLPVPPDPISIERNEAFAKVAIGKRADDQDKSKASEWRLVGLIPLSDEQIISFARFQNVSDPDQLLSDLQNRNAQEFARRPQDLIELCADWNQEKRIRTHYNQVDTNIRNKLLPRIDRSEPAQLSLDKALEGVKKLAFAMHMMRCFTVKYNTNSDHICEDSAVNPALILSNWTSKEINALLERPLFGFASYGRVRFHHRSVIDFLAAKQLLNFIEKGMSQRVLKQLLFINTNNVIIARPSKKSIAAWVALENDFVFELLRDNDPSVLMNDGDPESLSLQKKEQVIRAYCERYRFGGSRGLSTPNIQINRFVSEDFSKVIQEIWDNGIENPDIRTTLFRFIEVGRIKPCSDIVYKVVIDPDASVVERVAAFHALIAVKHEKLVDLSESIAKKEALCSERLVQVVAPYLFPDYMSFDQLFRTLKFMPYKSNKISNIYWLLSKRVIELKHNKVFLESFRDILVKLISDELSWDQDKYRIHSGRYYLKELLLVVCNCGLEISHDECWLRACALAAILPNYKNINNNDDVIKSFKNNLINLSWERNRKLFWVTLDLFQSLNKISEGYQQFNYLVHYASGVFEFKYERDLLWVLNDLKDIAIDISKKEILLCVFKYISSNHENFRVKCEELKLFLVERPELLKLIDDWFKPLVQDEQLLAQFLEEEKEREKQQENDAIRSAENLANWQEFYNKVIEEPEVMFSYDKAESTAYNILDVLSFHGEAKGYISWDRQIVEQFFNNDVTNKLRLTLMKLWRNAKPTYPSEVQESERNTYFTTWILGLAGIYAEAEDQAWASKLSTEEAVLVLRYIRFDCNGFPNWVNSFINEHSSLVEIHLGNELLWELKQDSYSMLLQSISHASELVVKPFLSCFKLWLDTLSTCNVNENCIEAVIIKLRDVIKLVFMYGDIETKNFFYQKANDYLNQNNVSELRMIWVQIVMLSNPESGVKLLEQELNKVKPGVNSKAVIWFANLFGDKRGSIYWWQDLFSPELLYRLLCLAHCHIRFEHDVHHEGVFTPDDRHAAEHARWFIMDCLLKSSGYEALTVKRKMANDPMFSYFKYRAIAIAEECMAKEIDSDIFNESEINNLESCLDVPILNNSTMFTVLKNRLEQIDDLLLMDSSPREEWALISKEKLMRRAISRELIHNANSIYNVDQEAVTADEKETDIRLRSNASDCQAAIELKLLNNNWSTNKLLDTIQQQLVSKYLAPENCRSGILLVTVVNDKPFFHPKTRKIINVEDLLVLLKNEAKRVQDFLANGTLIDVHLLDLRPRLK